MPLMSNMLENARKELAVFPPSSFTPFMWAHSHKKKNFVSENNHPFANSENIPETGSFSKQ